MSINLWFDYYRTMSAEYWMNFINGIGSDASYSVVTDSTRNIYTAGAAGAGQSNIHYVSSDIFAALPPFSGYVIKYDPYGLPLWRSFVSNTIPTANVVTANCVVAGSSAVYICGGSIGFAETYDSSGVGVSGGANRFVPRNCGYIVKYDINGSFVWRAFVANTLSSVTVTGTNINSLALDSSENVYAFGSIGSSSVTTTVNSNIYQATDSFPNAGTTVGFRQTVINNPIAFVIKFDTNGLFQWRAFIDNPGSAGIDASTYGTVDSNGDVYVTGYTGAITANIFPSTQTNIPTANAIPAYSAFLVKYDSSGAMKWRAYIDDPTATLTGLDYSYGVATDSLNNVYMCGRSGGGAAATIFNSNIYGTLSSGITVPVNSAYIVKYGPTGNFMWRAYIDGTGTDISNSIAIDSDRNIIVCGVTGNGVATIFNSSAVQTLTIPVSSGFVVKFNENGNVLNRYFISSTTGTVTGYGVATDGNSKNIITVGNTGTTNGLIYNSNADSTCFTGYSIPAGSSYIVKHNQYGVIPLQNGTYPSLVSNGWSVFWGNAIPAFSLGCFVTPDASSVYKVGITATSNVSLLFNADNSFSGYTIPSSSGCLAKYNSSGVFQWRIYLLGTSPIFTSVTADNSSVFVCGTSGTTASTLHDIYGNIIFTYPANSGVVIKYNSSGTIQYKLYITNSSINSVTSNSVNNAFIYIGGLTNPTPSSIIDNNGNTVGTITANTGFLIRLSSSDLSFQWISQFKPSSGTSICPVSSVSVTKSDDNVFCAGYSNASVAVNYTNSDSTTGTLLPLAQSNAAYVCKFNNLGVLQWKSYLDSLTATSQEIGTGVVTESSNVFFTGTTGTGTATAYNNSNTIYGGFRPINVSSAFLIKYDTNGNLLWYSNITAGSSTTSSNCVAVDSYGDVYIGGRGGNGGVISHSNIYGSITTGLTTVTDSAFISKYDGRTGRSIWRSYIDGTGTDGMRSISIDSSNYIYTSGFIGTGAASVFNANSVSSSITIPLSSSFMVKYKPNGNIIL